MSKPKFDYKKANERKREIGNRLNELAEKLESKEQLTEQQREAITTESRELKTELEATNMRIAAALANEAAEKQGREVTMTRNAMFRELLQDIRTGKRQEREITLGVVNEGDTNNIVSAEAMETMVFDLMPRLSEGLIWDKVGMKVQTGVTGNLVWPYATDNVKVVEVGETVQLQDQDINFDNVKATPAEVGATVKVSFASIEDATFDVLTFVQESFRLAMQDFLNHKTFSQATFTGIKGPYSGKTKTAVLVGNYHSLLEAKAELINAGVNMAGFCWVLDAKAEALLKATPKAKGQGGFIIENGKLDGDPYFVSHYIRENSTATGMLDDMYIGLGVWSYFAANQHGKIHMTVDPFTLADKGMMKLTLRTRWSLTTLRGQAFACYKLIEAPSGEAGINLNLHAKTIKVGETVQLAAAVLPKTAAVTYTSGTTAKATVTAAGLVEGKAVGSSVITASITVDGKTFTDTCTVTVEAAE